MKQIHPERWRQQILLGLQRRTSTASTASFHLQTRARGEVAQCLYHRQPHNHQRQSLQRLRLYSTQAVEQFEEPSATVEDSTQVDLTEFPSPPPSAALHSAKLSALYSRLALPHTLPLQTLARCLVHRTADTDSRFNNSSLAVLGADLLGYYTAEHLLCHYPRLPMAVLFAAQDAYVGPKACAEIVHSWGVQPVADPGGEVDPGLLQFKRTMPGDTQPKTKGLFEGDTSRIDKSKAWQMGVKRGMGARIVGDDQFGDFGSLIRANKERQTQVWERAQDTSEPVETDENSVVVERSHEAHNRNSTATQPADDVPLTTDLETASTSFFRSLVGAIMLHAGRPSALQFHNQHVLSRHLDLASMFHFRYPTRDLSRLCAREGFEAPVARLLSETGRLSIAPVFVVGVYSGLDKLGEGAGGSLDEARNRAAANALRGWYLYRPAEVTKPTDAEVTERKRDRKWIPNFIDLGEIVT
jgi:dsRNA-specific ribonuclease